MAISMNALKAQQRQKAEEPRQAPPADEPLTAQQLEAVEILRKRDGITRAGAASRVRAMSAAELQALLPKPAPVQKTPAPVQFAPPKQEQVLQPKKSPPKHEP